MIAGVIAAFTTTPAAASRASLAAATSPAPPAWEPQARVLTGAGPWLLAGEAASRAVPHSHPRVLFVGDSITQWWRRFGAATWNADFAPLGAVDDGVVGDTTSNVLARLYSGSLEGIDPRVVVVMVGTNNIPVHQTPAQIARGVLAVVQVVHQRLPSSRVVLLGVLPRDRPGSRYRREVGAINALLAKAAPTSAVTYLDLGSRLLGAGGAFLPGVIHPDLLHPTAAGYRRLAPPLLATLDTLLAAPRRDA